MRKRRRIRPLGAVLLTALTLSLVVLGAGVYQLMAVEMRMYDGVNNARRSTLTQEGAEGAALADTGELHKAPNAETLGVLTFPDAANSAVAIYAGTDAKSLEQGAGHAAGTSLPGAVGNCVLFGHRDSAFRAMQALKEDDVIRIESGKSVFSYRVTKLYVTTPEDGGIYAETDTAAITLVTCYPFRFVGPAPERYIAVAVME